MWKTLNEVKTVDLGLHSRGLGRENGWYPRAGGARRLTLWSAARVPCTGS